MPGVEKFRETSGGSDEGDKDVVVVEIKYKVGDGVFAATANSLGLYVQGGLETPSPKEAADF